MTHQVPWNKVILEEFIRIGCLSKTEEMIMRTRVHGWTITKQSYELKLKQFNEFKRNMQGKDPQKIVMDLLNSGRMSQQQFESLKQQAQQLQNFLK